MGYKSPPSAWCPQLVGVWNPHPLILLSPELLSPDSFFNNGSAMFVTIPGIKPRYSVSRCYEVQNFRFEATGNRQQATGNRKE
ncbi:MAG: hypothetical protein SWX82_05920 [Cyanobacteriota bacterium]|nr:hypothetical protein [Cyanobacteriota bacterium]